MTNHPITMIDYGASNIRSVQKAFEYVGATVQLTDDPAVVARATRLVVPGVGAFGTGMAALRARGLDNAIRASVGRGTPLLGICLGMQFLFDESNELGHHTGLGLIPGRVIRFHFDEAGAVAARLKVPHVGWNQIEHDGSHPLLKEIPDNAHAYFVHSYYCAPFDWGVVIAQTQYGRPFPSIVGRGNIVGIQFHPEKSQRVGLQLLRNFVELTRKEE